MQEHQVMRKLRALSVTAYSKIWANRFKGGPNQPVTGKWPEVGFTDGVRDWKKCPISSLIDKLYEEVQELIFEATDEKQGTLSNAVLEAGDVTAMAMMILDHVTPETQERDYLPPRVVCLCGSTRFKDAFMNAQYEETMKGNIVLSVGFFHHADVGTKPALLPEQKRALDQLHFRKIDLADEILVINVNGYVGESTVNEIEYAVRTGKDVRYLVHNVARQTQEE